MPARQRSDNSESSAAGQVRGSHPRFGQILSDGQGTAKGSRLAGPGIPLYADFALAPGRARQQRRSVVGWVVPVPAFRKDVGAALPSEVKEHR